MGALLEIDRLSVTFRLSHRTVAAVTDASLSIDNGGAVALVGESGSGKSTLARAILGLLPRATAEIRAAELAVCGATLDVNPATLASLRGRTIAMVFQDPLSYLNPLMRAGRQIGEAVALHDVEASIDERVRELLELVRLPAETAKAYPHELSGGMRQRVLIAIALACRPQLLIADEPTTALDATTQAEILSLLGDIRSRLGMALLLISHDLGTVKSLCDKIYVMYLGRTIEVGATPEVFDTPLHPYTEGLLRAARSLRDESGRFATLPGDISGSSATDVGCPFAPRCSLVRDVCRREMPGWRRPSTDTYHQARCWAVADG